MEGGKMTIALDFDDTYTADPDMWDEFIRSARSCGHRVICVTCRHHTLENIAEVDKAMHPLVLATYFTGHSPKRWYMERNNVKVDIWIDDMPEYVVHGV
jgi:hypothetical protein